MLIESLLKFTAHSLYILGLSIRVKLCIKLSDNELWRSNRTFIWPHTLGYSFTAPKKMKFAERAYAEPPLLGGICTWLWYRREKISLFVK